MDVCHVNLLDEVSSDKWRQKLGIEDKNY